MFKELSKFDKGIVILINLIRIYMFLTLLYFIYIGNIVHIFSVTISLIGTFIAFFVRKICKISLNFEFNLVIVLFIFLSNFLGESHGLFTSLWWWDQVMHTLSGLILPFVGILIFYKLSKNYKSPLILIILFAFFFANFVTLSFEFVEFSSDIISDNLYVMQDDGLVGTMTDLLCDFFGSLISSVYIYFVIKGKKKTFFFRKLVVEIIKNNPKQFKINLEN